MHGLPAAVVFLTILISTIHASVKISCFNMWKTMFTLLLICMLIQIECSLCEEEVLTQHFNDLSNKFCLPAIHFVLFIK